MEFVRSEFPQFCIWIVRPLSTSIASAIASSQRVKNCAIRIHPFACNHIKWTKRTGTKALPGLFFRIKWYAVWTICMNMGWKWEFKMARSEQKNEFFRDLHKNIYQILIEIHWDQRIVANRILNRFYEHIKFLLFHSLCSSIW